MRPSSIPYAVPAQPLPRDIPGLVWTHNQLGQLDGVGSPCSPEAAASGLLIPNTPVEFEDDGFVILGERLGEGRQGIVYSVTTCESACVKVCRNDRAAKQFRRERLGARNFDELGIVYPAILGGDSLGRWIAKERWRGRKTGEDLLATHARRLSPSAVLQLHSYVQKFENAGICADWMPSNVVFGPDGCASFETGTWPIKTTNWSFSTCFLPFWLPHGIREREVEGFPPYSFPSDLVDRVRRAWDSEPAYQAWRDCFGQFPPLSCDWWTV